MRRRLTISFSHLSFIRETLDSSMRRRRMRRLSYKTPAARAAAGRLASVPLPLPPPLPSLTHHTRTYEPLSLSSRLSLSLSRPSPLVSQSPHVCGDHLPGVKTKRRRRALRQLWLARHRSPVVSSPRPHLRLRSPLRRRCARPHLCCRRSRTERKADSREFNEAA